MYSIPALLAWTILFRGGKTLESIWLLVGVAAILTLLYYFDQRKKKSLVPVSRSIWIPLMLFVGFSWISFLLSLTQNYGLDEMFQTSALALIFLLIYRSGLPVATDRFLKFFAFLTILACFFGLAVYILEPVNRFVGTFVDLRFTTDYWPNAWAEFLLLAWPIALFNERRKHPDLEHLLLRGIVLGLITGCLLLSYSRGAIIAFGGELILGLILILSRHTLAKDWYKHCEVGVIALVTAGALFFTANQMREQFFPVQSVTSKLTFTSVEGTSSIDERSQFWRQAIQLSGARPLVGWGPYSFRFIQPRLQTGVLATSDHPHNVFLKYAAERGIPAALAFLVFIYVILSQSARVIFGSTRKKLELPEHAFFFIAIMGVLAHNLIDYNLQFTAIALPLWIFLALLARTYVPSRRSETFDVGTQRTTEVIIACVILIIAIVEGRFLVLSSLGRHAEAQGNVSAALAYYGKADHELFSRDLHLSRAQLELQSGNRPEAMHALDLYLGQNRQDARAWKMKADMLLIAGKTSDIRSLYHLAYDWNKWNDISTATAFVSILDDPKLVQTDLINLMHQYRTAIDNNTHFISLSQNVEAFEQYVDMLASKNIITVEEAAKQKSEVATKAKIDRDIWSAQSSGLLW